jgi:hypothetical protein
MSDYMYVVERFKRKEPGDLDFNTDSTKLEFAMSEDATWFAIMERFVYFLRGCGFFIDTNHPVCNLDELHDEFIDNQLARQRKLDELIGANEE